mgnify:CR=1 FL=1
MQNKQAYSPEVVRCIIWAIIVDTRSYFDDIKLAERTEQMHWVSRLQSALRDGIHAVRG